MIICIAEDRKWCEAPVKLLLLSLAEHCPDLPIELFYPPADAPFIEWLRRCPQVHLNTAPLEGAYRWNVKPHALLSLFERGHSEALWIDSDVIVARDFQDLFTDLEPGTLCVTEDALQSGNRLDNNPPRAHSWGFPIGRALPFATNTAILRVTRSHIPLLERWKELLESETYRAAQSQKEGRPNGMFGDQDVLTALLASEEFSAVPLKFLYRGKDIIQFFSYHGYTCAERIGNLLRGLPPFVHSQVNKPWLASKQEKPAFEFSGNYRIKSLTNLYLEASPYTLLATRYQSRLEEDTSWMQARTFAGKLLRMLGFGYPPLVGLPIAMLTDLFRVKKRFLPAHHQSSVPDAA